MKTSRRLVADLTGGEDQETKKALQLAGVTADDWAAIAYDREMRDEVVNAIIRHRLFSTPEEQIERILEINSAVWMDDAITESAIRRIGPPPNVTGAPRNLLRGVILLYETGDPRTTLLLNWYAFQHVYSGRATLARDLFAYSGIIQVRQNAIVRPAGFRWSAITLGWKAVLDLENATKIFDSSQIMGIGQELPLIAALHPRWARFMGSDEIPFIVASDIEIRLPYTNVPQHLFLKREGTNFALAYVPHTDPQPNTSIAFFD